MHDVQIVKKRLKLLRAERGLTQKEVAEAIHFSVSTIKQYESGYRIPEKANLNCLASFYQVYPEYILGEVDFRDSKEKMSHYWKQYDAEHKKDIEEIKRDIALFEAVNTITSTQFGFNDSDEDLFPEFLKYIDQFKERKEKIMKLSDVKVVASETINEVRENFETGEITIYASSEENVRKAIDQLIKRGMVEE